MKTHTIVKKQAKLDWSLVPSVSMEYLALNTPPSDISAKAQICYDEEALYLRLSAVEKDILATYTGIIDSPCEESCLEFFFCPMEGDNRYFNIEFNPNCCMYLGYGSGLSTLVRLLPDGDSPLSPKAARTEDGWEITYQVPYEFIRRFFPDFKVESGKTMRANFYKCGEKTKLEHYLTWNPLKEGVITFHTPEDFGLLTFE